MTPPACCFLTGWVAPNLLAFQALFKQLLAEPALQDVTSGTVTTLAHARYLVLKNLAGSLVHDDATCKEALQFYIEASELDCNDTVLWHRLGSLVSSAKCVLLLWEHSDNGSDMSNPADSVTTIVPVAG